jgi:uncharacterized protein YjiS (DUF1127 family)
MSSINATLPVFAKWIVRRRRRRAALFIDRHTLGDIGLVRAEIDLEAGKAFWAA